MRRRAMLVVAAPFVLATTLGACSSSSESESTDGTTDSTTDSSMAPTTTSHMMGMATGPDPDPADVDASPYVFVILPNGSMPLDPGTVREVSVVAQGEPMETTNEVPVVVRNMTRDTVHGIQGHVDLVGADGQVIDSGPFSFLAPFVVAPGEIAFGAMNLGEGWDLSAGTLRAKVDSFNLMAPGSEARSMAVITEANVISDAITGTATNDTEAPLSGGVNVTAMCFDSIRRPFHVASVDVEGDLPGGESAVFSIPLRGEAAQCTQVLLTAVERE